MLNAFLAFALFLMAPIVFALNQGGSEEDYSARSEVASMQSFLLLANYVVAREPFTGASNQIRTAANLKSSPNVPPALKQTSFPSSWYIIGNSSNWTACVTLSEKAIGLIGRNMFSDDGSGPQVGSLSAETSGSRPILRFAPKGGSSGGPPCV